MKPKTPSQKKAYDALNARLAKYMAQVQGIYDDICLRLANAVSLTDYDGVVEFLFKNYPELASLIGQLMTDYAAQMNSLIYSGTSEEWKQSNLLQDLLVEKAMKVYGFDKGGDKYNRYFQTGNAALKAFQQRKDRGLNLSQKLWRQSEELKKELECALSVAIERGTSAITLSKRLSQYLVDFPKLKADYTDKFGHAASCRDCEYASMRLARSEINMAYRTAEHLRWQQFDFILGFDVKLSGRHPAPDICDDLKGRYPKDFKFTGWHPNCMCYTVPVVMTDDEYMSDDATRAAKDVPDGFKRWIDNNIHRAKSWESTPYFIRDNSKYIREDFKVNVYNKTEKSFARKRRTNLAMSRVEYYNKVYPDIPEVQLAAVNAYTQAVVKGNNGATSREINRRLRNGTADEYVTAASTLISSALQKLPEYTGVTYRGETMTMNKLQERILSHVGETISDKGFFSTSRYTDTPMKFITHDGVPKSHKRVIFEIQGKNGRDISKISEFNGIFTTENQHEVLFDKGTKFFVSPDMKTENGILKIKLIEQ